MSDVEIANSAAGFAGAPATPPAFAVKQDVPGFSPTKTEENIVFERVER